MPPNALTINYYVEAGCLGEHGEDRIQGFCQFLQLKFNQNQANICSWQVKQLTDIHQPHIQYFLANKKLTNEQASRYLEALKQNKDAFEDNIDEIVIDLIDDYLER